MKYAVFSDVHANLHALESVIADARSLGAERFVCLGDIVGYGPLPAEALARVRATAAVVLAGNHDHAVAGLADPAEFIDLAADAVARHRDALDASSLAWLKSLPLTAELDGAAFAHGDFTEPAAFNYVDGAESAAANFNALPTAQLMFVGHTHVPGIFLTGASGSVYELAPQDFVLEPGKRYLVNPGSVGYPRESGGQCYSSYIIYDSYEQSVTFRLLPFAVASMLQRGRAPRRLRKSVIAALVLTAALLAGALALLLKPSATEYALDPALVVESRELVLAAADGREGASAPVVCANLKLEKNSAPAELRIRCFGGDGAALPGTAVKVASSSTRKFKLPAGTVRAEISVLRYAPGDRVEIKSFQPQ